MSFSYDFNTNPLVAYVRLLIADTVNTVASPAVFSDEEVTAAYTIQASVFQSSMYFSQASGQNIPQSPVSYFRVSAILLDALSSNNSRLSGILQVLNVKADLSKAAIQLRAQADNYRCIDDDAGAFMIIEQVNDQFSFADRYWKQSQRVVGGGGF